MNVEVVLSELSLKTRSDTKKSIKASRDIIFSLTHSVHVRRVKAFFRQKRESSNCASQKKKTKCEREKEKK